MLFAPPAAPGDSKASTQHLGFGVWGLGFIGCIGSIAFIGFIRFRVWGLSLELRVQGLRFRV